jgi:hypothetical protein
MRRIVIEGQEFSNVNLKYGDLDNIINYTFENCKFNRVYIYFFANNVNFINCEFKSDCKLMRRLPLTIELNGVKTSSGGQSLIIISDLTLINHSNINKAEINSDEVEINNSSFDKSQISYKKSIIINDSNVVDTEIKPSSTRKKEEYSNSYVNNKYYDLILKNVRQKKF